LSEPEGKKRLRYTQVGGGGLVSTERAYKLFGRGVTLQEKRKIILSLDISRRAKKEIFFATDLTGGN